MIAILLAAAAGRKFWPYNEVRNKCAFPIANVPIVRRLAQQLLDAGPARVVVALGPHGGPRRAALSGLDGRVSFVSQPQPGGTAEAALRCLDGLDEEAV